MTTTTLSVTVTIDEADGSASIGGGLSLRDAIITAIGNPAEEFIIELTGGVTYDLTLQGNDDLAAVGDLDIVNGANITIRSIGDEPAIIDAGGEEGLANRLFQVDSESSLTLESVELRGGVTRFVEGSAIFNDGTLEVSDSLIADNNASGTGGDGAISNNGVATITNATISDNAGARVAGVINTGDLTIIDSNILRNVASTPVGGTGGVSNEGGTLTIENSVISENSSNGAAIDNDISIGSGVATARIVGSIISDNASTGIDNSGVLTISESTISGNSTSGIGGGIFNVSGVVSVGLLAIDQTLITGNIAAQGGGIANSSNDDLVITNSTITENIAENGGGGIDNNDDAELTLINNTISSNIGGGIQNDGDLLLVNTVIADNQETLDDEDDAADLSGDTGVITLGSNIVADNSLSPALAGVIAVDPTTLNFSSLQDNGGPTVSLLPLEGNPVINAGSNEFLSESAFTQDLNGDGDTEDFGETGIDFNLDGDFDDSIILDQRGFLRVFDTAVDIGATEFESIIPEFPVFTSPIAFSVAENISTVATITATDLQDDPISFSITGGVDQSAFQIDAQTGELSFQALPDFENPSDADGDNVFEVDISVSDPDSNSLTQDITVTVTDDLDSVLPAPLSFGFTTDPDTSIADGLISDGLIVETVGNADASPVLADDPLSSGTDAVFDNLLGLYQVVDANGGVLLDDGTVLLPGDVGYAEAALSALVDNFEIRGGSSGDPLLNTVADDFNAAANPVILEGDAFYAPVLLANGGGLGFDGFVAQELGETDGVFNDAADFFGDQVAYFSFVGANPDGAAHIQALGNNIFGFEDVDANLGSDNDFNDLVAQFNVV